MRSPPPARSCRCPLEADEIVRRSMRIAGEICVYTNFDLKKYRKPLNLMSDLTPRRNCLRTRPLHRGSRRRQTRRHHRYSQRLDDLELDAWGGRWREEMVPEDTS